MLENNMLSLNLYICAKAKVFQFLGKLYSPPLFDIISLCCFPVLVVVVVVVAARVSPSIRSAKLNSIWESVDRACPRANIASDLSNARATLSCCHLLVLQGYT